MTTQRVNEEAPPLTTIKTNTKKIDDVDEKLDRLIIMTENNLKATDNNRRAIEANAQEINRERRIRKEEIEQERKIRETRWRIQLAGLFGSALIIAIMLALLLAR